VPSWHQLLVDNDPGQFTQPRAEPLLIIQGGNDEQIPVVSSQILFGQLCTIGQGTQRWIYPGESHSGVVGVSIEDMLGWVTDRFAGLPVAASKTPAPEREIDTTACAAAVTTTTSTTTTTLPPTTTTTTVPKATSTTVGITPTTTTTRVDPGATTAAPTASATTTTAPAQVLGAQTSRGALSFTGMDVKRWLELALFFLLTGALLVVNTKADRRRPSS
jgi:hypothetical protein